MSRGQRVPGDAGERARAATEFATNFVVSAGAGTGKTTLLVTRLLAAIESGRTPLSEIAAITFTEKAAGELRTRLAESLRERGLREAERQLDRAAVMTIHGLCAEILRAHPLESGLAPGFAIDRGMSGRRLADEEWTPFVSTELGPEGRRPELWDRVLQKFSLAQLAEIARVLAGGSISDSALQAEHRPLDLRESIGPEAHRLAAAIHEAVDATTGLTEAPRTWLTEAEGALLALATDGTAAARRAIEDSSRLPDAMPSASTKMVSESQSARITALSEQALPLLRGLALCDERAEADLFELVLPFARRLRARQTLSGLVDFDGLLVRTRDLLRDAPEVRAALKRRYRMILVDEFQDTDPVQYEIVFLLAEREGECASDAYETHLDPGRLFIVGDAKQSIYRFRGADYGAYRRAVRHVLDQGGEELTLSSNFRSTDAVLDSVNALFAEPGSSVWSTSPYLPPYVPIHAERKGESAPAVEIWTPVVAAGALAETRRRAEGLALAAEISAFAGDGRRWRYNDILVLFRGFSDLAPYLRAMREAGVPFVVSGGRTFFERTEIIQAMAVLRAVADPEDPVALLAYRRSPAGGVPDTELAAGSGAPAPTVAQADNRLAVLRADAAALPADAAIRHVLEASGLFALSSLSFEGAQRIANLEKLALAASDLARDGRRTLLETVEALEEGFESDDAGDSPLADAAFDAVRVMSIHSAKGLEAPVVILADTAAGRSNRGVTKFSARMMRAAHGEFVRLEGPGFRNAASIAASIDNARHEAAEDVRLLYVALTRARDRLIVFGGGNRKSPWSEAVSSWSEGVTRRALAAPAPPTPTGVLAAPGAPEAVTRFESAVATIRSEPVLPFNSPSDLEGVEGPWIGSPLDAELAREAGRIVHARLSGVTTPEAGRSSEEAERILREFAASPLAARLAGLDVLGREVPMLLAQGHARWRGTIDLLYRDEDGTVVAADFKTDASDEGAIERHRGQLTIYLHAVRAAMPGELVRAELWMLRSGHVLEV